MKMTQEQYDTLKALFIRCGWLREVVRDLKEQLECDGEVKDVNKQLRWDLFWGVKRIFDEEVTAFMDDAYKTMNDTNLDTALKKIVKELYGM